MEKKILHQNLTKKEIDHLYKLRISNVKEIKLRTTSHKLEILTKLLDHINTNKEVYSDKNLCKYLNIKTRTLNRYILELEKQKLITKKLTNFKTGGRGYVVKSTISKKENS